MNDPIGDHDSVLFNPVNYVLREVTRVTYRLVTEGLIQTFIKERK